MSKNNNKNKMSIEYITNSVNNSTSNTGTANNPIHISPDTNTWITDTNKQFLIGKTDILAAFKNLKESEKNLAECQKSLARYVPRDKVKKLYNDIDDRKDALNKAEADLIDVYSKNPTVDTTKWTDVVKIGVPQLDKTPNKQGMDVLYTTSTTTKLRSEYFEVWSNRLPITAENRDVMLKYWDAFAKFRSENVNIDQMNINQFWYLKSLAEKLNAEVSQNEPGGNTKDKGKAQAQDTQIDLTQEEPGGNTKDKGKARAQDTQEETGQPESSGTKRRFDPNWEETGQPESSGSKRSAFIDLTHEETGQPESSEPKRQKTGVDQTSDNQDENTNQNQRTESIIDNYTDTDLDMPDNTDTDLDMPDNADTDLYLPDYIYYYDEIFQLIKDEILNIGFMLWCL